jgi:hypothetical protein
MMLLWPNQSPEPTAVGAVSSARSACAPIISLQLNSVHSVILSKIRGGFRRRFFSGSIFTV